MRLPCRASPAVKLRGSDITIVSRGAKGCADAAEIPSPSFPPKGAGSVAGSPAVDGRSGRPGKKARPGAASATPGRKLMPGGAENRRQPGLELPEVVVTRLTCSNCCRSNRPARPEAHDRPQRSRCSSSLPWRRRPHSRSSGTRCTCRRRSRSNRSIRRHHRHRTTRSDHQPGERGPWRPRRGTWT